jgi:DNA-binding NtrC family response regulator
VTLTIPPLRERRDDILPLAEAYLHYFAGHLGREVNAITSDAADALVRYDWPGNVRELANVIEHAVLLSDVPIVSPQSLPLTLRPPGGESVAGSTPQVDEWATRRQHWHGRTWREVRDDVLRTTERDYLTHVLRSTGGRVGEAARIAGMDPRSLFDKLKAHGIRKEEFKPDVQGRADAGRPGRRRPSG